MSAITTPVSVGPHGLLATAPTAVKIPRPFAHSLKLRSNGTDSESKSAQDDLIAESSSRRDEDDEAMDSSDESMLDIAGSSAKYVSTKLLLLPGQVLPTESDAIRGHGTHIRPHDGAIAASVGGFLGRVGKLVSVASTRQKYRGDVGDVVVGRVAVVGQKSWRVELNAAQLATLQLSAVNLPGGVLRRRTTTDQLQMRELFMENDVVVAEVQQVHHDGAVALHARSLRYGRMGVGQLVCVRASLVRRTKNQFHKFPFGVDIIVGMNGLIWVAPRTVDLQAAADSADASAAGFSEELVANRSHNQEVSREVRDRIARVRACILILAQQHLPVFPEAIGHVYKRSIDARIESYDMLNAEHVELLSVGAETIAL